MSPRLNVRLALRKESLVTYSSAKLVVLLALVVATSWAPSSARAVVDNGQGPSLTSLGPLAFSADAPAEPELPVVKTT